jgi:glycosyltransferase involved in cell wall biosynthesis
MTGSGKWPLGPDETLIPAHPALAEPACRLVALTRVRNEALILPDTLDHVARFADAIVAYDDASTDRTLELLLGHPKVAYVVANRRWQSGVDARLLAETRHRGLLLELVRERFAAQWCFCFDADERYVGDVRGLTEGLPASVDGVRVRLFDAYMTADDAQAFPGTRPLLDFRRHFGPERRDILMLWRNQPHIRFDGLDRREPYGAESCVVDLHCQHYGKALSIEHWEATCDYYVRNFPEDPYGRKWRARKGKAIHQLSDFGRPLHPWGKDLFDVAVLIG